MPSPRTASRRPFSALPSARHLAALALAALLAGACGDAGDGAGGGGGGGEAPTATPLGLNDVSVLFPLPTSDDAAGYLSATDVGARGELLPRDVYDGVPTFPVTPAEGLSYERMRALSLRFDACGGGPGACLPEIRLVMQPFVGGRARDSALHLFYRLDDAAIAEVVAGLRALRELAPEAAVDAPLDVHPALVAQGVTGAYGAALRELVLAHAGEENLVRMTFFLRAPPTNEVWFFGGFERDAGVLSPMDVVGVGVDPQRVILTKTSSTYEFDLTPAGITPENGATLYASATAEAATDEARQAAMASYLRVENPTVYVPDELPCAGCHIASYVTAEAQRRFALDPTTFAERYTSARDLTQRGGSAANPSSLRAFGWFGPEPMIAVRTINESAAVLDDLEARFPE